MDALKVTQQMLSFQQQAYENLQSIWQLTQKQASNTVDRMMDQAVWMPKEGRQVLESWRSMMTQERERFTAFIDRGFTIYKEMLEPSKPTPAVKTKKTETAQ